jgi:hypothetical protein
MIRRRARRRSNRVRDNRSYGRAKVNEWVRKTNAELKKEGGVGMEKIGMQSSLLNFDLTVQVSREERGYLTVQVSREKSRVI